MFDTGSDSSKGRRLLRAAMPPPPPPDFHTLNSAGGPA